MRYLPLLAALLIPATLTAGGSGPQYTSTVEIEGIAAGFFASVGEISGEIEVIEYQDGDDRILRKRPGRVKYGDITLKRGYTADPDLWTWWKDGAMGRVDRRSMSLILRNTVGAEVARFNFHECWPFRWKLSGFDGSTASVLTEEVTVVTEHFAPGS